MNNPEQPSDLKPSREEMLKQVESGLKDQVSKEELDAFSESQQEAA